MKSIFRKSGKNYQKISIYLEDLNHTAGQYTTFNNECNPSYENKEYEQVSSEVKQLDITNNLHRSKVCIAKQFLH